MHMNILVRKLIISGPSTNQKRVFFSGNVCWPGYEAIAPFEKNSEKKYHRLTALDNLDNCYTGWPPALPHRGIRGTGQQWLEHELLQHLMLPTEFNEDEKPDREKIYDIIEIDDALVTFDKMPYVEKCPKPGSGSDELKELIDKRRADVERECQEATANPDARTQYSWLVALSAECRIALLGALLRIWAA